MPTINQILRKKTIKKTQVKPISILSKSPQKQGICQKIYTMSPKKPNSALRKVVKVKLSYGKEIIAYIPGEGHKLQPHNFVLIKGGHVKDLPGVNFKVIRGTRELSGVINRKNSRSLYGTKK